MSEDTQKMEIEIKEDPKTKDKDAKIKELEEKLEEIETEKEDYKSKLQLISEKELEKQRKEVGAPADITPEQLVGFKLAKQGKTSAPVGSAPLNDAQLGISDELLTKQYATPQALVEDLRKRIEAGGPDGEKAKLIHDEFLRRALKNPRLWHGQSEGVGLEAIRRKTKKQKKGE